MTLRNDFSSLVLCKHVTELNVINFSLGVVFFDDVAGNEIILIIFKFV